MDADFSNLHFLLVKRFGNRYVRNLINGTYLQINFDSPGSFGPETKCIECPATQYRQDLPYWHGTLPKSYMLVAQDAGKGEEHPDKPDFNTVFSIHELFTKPKKYLSKARHSRYRDYLLAMLPDEEALRQMYFTDLIKCAFSTGRMDASACPCRNDLLVEMAAVRPRIVIFFGAKAFSTGMAIFQAGGSDFVPSGDPICVRINKRQKLAIHMGRFTGRSELFIAIPQLGQNRFSNEGFKSMLEVMRNEVRTAIARFIANEDGASSTAHVRIQG